MADESAPTTKGIIMKKTPQHILITGAAGAIASALTQVFAQQFPHAHFTLVDINESALIEKVRVLGKNADYVLWDLFQPESLAEGWQQVITKHGAVDILINCAGIMDIISFQGTGWNLGWKLAERCSNSSTLCDCKRSKYFIIPVQPDTVVNIAHTQRILRYINMVEFNQNKFN